MNRTLQPKKVSSLNYYRKEQEIITRLLRSETSCCMHHPWGFFFDGPLLWRFINNINTFCLMKWPLCYPLISKKRAIFHFDYNKACREQKKMVGWGGNEVFWTLLMAKRPHVDLVRSLYSRSVKRPTEWVRWNLENEAPFRHLIRLFTRGLFAWDGQLTIAFSSRRHVALYSSRPPPPPPPSLFFGEWSSIKVKQHDVYRLNFITQVLHPTNIFISKGHPARFFFTKIIKGFPRRKREGKPREVASSDVDIGHHDCEGLISEHRGLT